MSMVRTRLARLSLILLASATVASCATMPGLGFDQFSISLSSTQAEVVQGSSTTTTLTFTRATDYIGSIDLEASGQPAGVEVNFSVPKSNTNPSDAITIVVGKVVPPDVYQIIIRALGSSTEEATFTLTVLQGSNFTLRVQPAQVSLAQGSSAPPLTVFIDRNNFAGGVTLTTIPDSRLPVVLATPNPQTGNSVTVTLTATPTAPIGISTLRFFATGAGISGTEIAEVAVTVTPLVVTGNFTLSTTSPVSVVQGGSLPVTVNIPRTGGNASDVALTATFAGTPPADLTLGFLPASTTSTSSVLTVATTAGTPAGSYPFVIHGIAAGLAEQTTNITVNVTAPVNVTVTFASCTAANKPLWLAYRDGTTGTWTPVTGVADVYTFPIAQAKGSFAYVTMPFASARTFVQHKTQAELTAGPINPCVAATPPGSALQGTLINLPAGSEALIDFGGASALVSANGNFQLNNTPAGTFDLIGFARSTTTGAATRAFIQRGITPPAGTFSVTVDFAHGTRSDNAVAGAGTLTGLTGAETELYSSMTYYTQGAACRASLLYSAVGSPAGFNFYGIPPSLRVPATDMHSLQLTVIDGAGSSRSLTEAFVDVTARAAAPFLLPAPILTATASNAGGPYKRPSVAVTGLPAEYNVSHTLFYIDNGGSGEQGTIVATPGWVGGSSVTLDLPNFSGVGGFQDAWGPAPSDLLNWNFRSVGGASAASCVAGQRMVSATRTGTI